MDNRSAIVLFIQTKASVDIETHCVCIKPVHRRDAEGSHATALPAPNGPQIYYGVVFSNVTVVLYGITFVCVQSMRTKPHTTKSQTSLTFGDSLSKESPAHGPASYSTVCKNTFHVPDTCLRSNEGAFPI